MTRHELEDERTFLLRSLEDLDREHEAGDLSDEDHAVLRDGYIARTAEVLKVSRSGPVAAVAPRRPRSTARRVAPHGEVGAAPSAGRSWSLVAVAGR